MVAAGGVREAFNSQILDMITFLLTHTEFYVKAEGLSCMIIPSSDNSKICLLYICHESLLVLVENERE